jgi:hypothetical protein
MKRLKLCELNTFLCTEICVTFLVIWRKPASKIFSQKLPVVFRSHGVSLGYDAMMQCLVMMFRVHVPSHSGAFGGGQFQPQRS